MSKSLHISVNESAERLKIPRQLTDGFTYLTGNIESLVLAEAVDVYLFSFVH